MFVGMAWCQSVQNPTQTGLEDETFLMDSGATSHIVSNERALTELEECDEKIIVGDKREIPVKKKGTLTLKTSGDHLVKLKDTLVVPEMALNVISIGKLAEQGNKVMFGNNELKIVSGVREIVIEKEKETPMYFLKAERVTVTSEGTAMPIKEKSSHKTMIDINDAHELYGHVSEGPLRSILARNNYIVKGTKKTCEPCAYAKAKAKSVSKTASIKATEKGERLYIDISGPYKKSLIGSKYWILVVDDKTRKAWSFFVKKKSDIKQVAKTLVTLLKGAQVITKYMRCDNAGENAAGLKQVCDEFGIKMEFTAPNTPQLNGVVERKFVVIRDRGLAIMLGAGLNEEHQGKLWAEAMNTATKLTNVAPTMATGKPPDEMWYGEYQNWTKHLKKWGQIGFVTIRIKQRKLDTKSIKCVFVGYADDHAGDTYRMYNPETGKVILSRDIKWADWHGSSDLAPSLKMFADDMAVEVDDDVIGENWAVTSGEDDDDDAAGAGRKTGPHLIEDDAPPAKDPKTSRLERELTRLRAYYNPDADAGNAVSDDEDKGTTTRTTR